MASPQHKIIFEGAELTGKSYLLSQIYEQIEPKYNSGGRILDGCHWFNCDVGIFGTAWGAAAIDKYLDLVEVLAESNVMLEKFHLTEAVYQKIYNNHDFDFSRIEKRLKILGTKIIMVTFDEDEALLAKRLADRLKLYPHYSRIAQKPLDYIHQQRVYLELLKKSQLEHLIVNASELPNPPLVKMILKFLEGK